MKQRKSISNKELKELIQQSRDFILALSQGANSAQLDKIRRRMIKQNEKDASGINLYPGNNRKSVL